MLHRFDKEADRTNCPVSKIIDGYLMEHGAPEDYMTHSRGQALVYNFYIQELLKESRLEELLHIDFEFVVSVIIETFQMYVCKGGDKTFSECLKFILDANFDSLVGGHSLLVSYFEFDSAKNRLSDRFNEVDLLMVHQGKDTSSVSYREQEYPLFKGHQKL